METQNYTAEMERRAAENARRIEAAAREKVAQRMREADQKRMEQYAQQRREEDRRRAEEARKRERQQQELRAKAREHAKAKAAEVLKKEAEKAKESQQKQMQGASQGPTMRPSSGDKNRDALEQMAEMDHPGLTDAQKSVLQQQGAAVGEGFKNREAQRQKEAEAREARKTPADKAQDAAWFKQGVPYDERQRREIARDKRRVMQIEQAKNEQVRAQVKAPGKAQMREPEKAQTKAPPAKAPAKQPFEFAKEPEDPVKGR